MFEEPLPSSDEESSLHESDTGKDDSADDDADYYVNEEVLQNVSEIENAS
ncbi:Hypothetical protein CINCED_3A025224 [Cinara cedri]|uniref:Uncharacterized protein n=1 Tax=Cinara cedri TaxID=506608 RepID=A0A5E4NF99_9HEMI|nr:Hypothetical protein CINCED_3A025224 [Cinara cedri]